MDNKSFSCQKVNKSYKEVAHKSLLKTKESIRMLPKKNSDFFLKSPDFQQPVSTKNVFDKNKWRSLKYSKKNKLDSWKEKRKNYFLHEYLKRETKEKQVKFDVKKIYEEEEIKATENNIVEEQVDQKGKKSEREMKNFKKTSDKKTGKQKQKEEFLKEKSEKGELIKKRKKEKAEMYKKLNKRTKKGQPIMKGYIENLFEKIQKNIN